MDQEIKRKIVTLLKQADVTRAAIFGSLARGEANPESDVDMLVEFQGDKSLLDLIQLKRELELVLDRKVDLLTYKSLSPFLRDAILREHLPIYG